MSDDSTCLPVLTPLRRDCRVCGDTGEVTSPGPCRWGSARGDRLDRLACQEQPGRFSPSFGYDRRRRGSSWRRHIRKRFQNPFVPLSQEGPRGFPLGQPNSYVCIEGAALHFQPALAGGATVSSFTVSRGAGASLMMIVTACTGYYSLSALEENHCWSGPRQEQ